MLQRQRLLVLNFAELRELPEVMRVRALPGIVVRRAKKAPVIGRTWIRIERHRIIGPHAVALQPLAPPFHKISLVSRHGDEIRLNKRHGLTRADEQIRQLIGREATLLGERSTALLRETLDASFDGNTSGSPHEVEHIRLPQINSGLHPELNVS